MTTIERMDDYMITAEVTMQDGRKIIMSFMDPQCMSAWCATHGAEYVSIRVLTGPGAR